MSNLWKSICGTLIAAAVLAGASGLVLSRVTAAEVADLKEQVSTLDERDRENAKKLERVESNGQSTKESVERIEQKLDRLLDQVPPRR